jgi:hypothetical protein
VYSKCSFRLQSLSLVCVFQFQRGWQWPSGGGRGKGHWQGRGHWGERWEGRSVGGRMGWRGGSVGEWAGGRGGGRVCGNEWVGGRLGGSVDFMEEIVISICCIIQ